jgi:DDE superfamily endonuclease
LQEDNDPKHRSKKAEDWRVKNQVKHLSWASQSPDLNPMENVWAVLKANVNNHKPSSVKELKKIIQKEWKKLDDIFAQNLVISMKNCIALLLSNGGDHLLY